MPYLCNVRSRCWKLAAERERRYARSLRELALAVFWESTAWRHPKLEKKAINQIKKALKQNGKLYIDEGDPLKSIPL